MDVCVCVAVMLLETFSNFANHPSLGKINTLCTRHDEQTQRTHQI